MTVIDELIADPKKFLKKHVVIVNADLKMSRMVPIDEESTKRKKDPSEPTLGKKEIIKWLQLTEQNWKIKKKMDESKCYYLELGEKGQAGHFETYWLSYEKYKTKRLYVGRAATLMFTAAMDGCSFGVGSKSPDGVLITHANRADVGDSSKEKVKDRMKQQIKAQVVDTNTSMQKKGEDNPTIIHSINHKEKNLGKSPLGATVCGVYKDEKWTFYMQKREKIGSGVNAEWQIRDVIVV